MGSFVSSSSNNICNGIFVIDELLTIIGVVKSYGIYNEILSTWIEKVHVMEMSVGCCLLFFFLTINDQQGESVNKRG